MGKSNIPCEIENFNENNMITAQQINILYNLLISQVIIEILLLKRVRDLLKAQS